MSWVLIVEDHALFREGLALLLKWRTGLDNVQSGSIDEARRILGDAKEEPVCAVVDLDLPDGDGIDLLERLRGLPVVALVSDRSLERCVRALEAGADEVLDKGESSEKIRSAVVSLLPRSTERMGATVQQPWAKRTGAMFLAPGCVYSPCPSFSRTPRVASTSAASAAACAFSSRCLRVAHSGPVSQALGAATGD